MMKLLYITTRSPDSPDERDGGAIFAAQLINYMLPRSCLDILFLRALDGEMPELSRFNAVYFLTPDMSITNRFHRRLATSELVGDWLSTRQDIYDAILVQHVSSGFGIVRLSAITRAKMILFPMFTGISYHRSGEEVPPAYIAAETKVLQSAGLIICPSRSEAVDIIEGYGVDETNIQYAPFGIDLERFEFRQRRLGGPELDLLYIATIKKQKNQLDCIQILENLPELGIKARIHLVGGIGDLEYYSALQKAIVRLGLSDRLHYHGVLASGEIVQLASNCHFSISTSRWETFGIAVFESLAMGLPVIAYEDVSCFWEYLASNAACIGVERSPMAMAERIAAFHADPADYEWRSTQARQAVAHLGLDNVLSDIFEQIKSFTGERA